MVTPWQVALGALAILSPLVARPSMAQGPIAYLGCTPLSHDLASATADERTALVARHFEAGRAQRLHELDAGGARWTLVAIHADSSPGGSFEQELAAVHCRADACVATTIARTSYWGDCGGGGVSIERAAIVAVGTVTALRVELVYDIAPNGIDQGWQEYGSWRGRAVALRYHDSRGVLAGWNALATSLTDYWELTDVRPPPNHSFRVELGARGVRFAGARGPVRVAARWRDLERVDREDGDATRADEWLWGRGPPEPAP